MSERGVYVVVLPVPDTGEKLRLSFTLPQETTPIRAEVRVAWRNLPSLSKGCGSRAFNLPPGCGLEFVVIDKADLERIDAHVRVTPMFRKRAEWPAA